MKVEVKVDGKIVKTVHVTKNCDIKMTIRNGFADKFSVNNIDKLGIKL